MMTAGSFEYTQLKQVMFGQPLADSLRTLLQADFSQRGTVPRVMCVMSASLNRQAGLAQQLKAWSGMDLVATCDRIRAHSPRPDVLAALAIARAANVDILLSIGGGSVIDACKVVQFCLNAGIGTEHELLRYARFSDGRSGDRCAVEPPFQRGPAVYQIAVPTTLSAAEFSGNAGITDPQTASKEGYRAPSLCPTAVIYEPFLSQLTPPWLWLSTAIRSLDHAIEGYCSADAFPFLQGQYLHAMRILANSLPAVYRNPDDLLARNLNQQAVWAAGCALGKVRHGASHGIGYVLGTQCGVPHGYTSCVMLPAVLAWNEPTNRAQQEVIAEAMGFRPGNLAGSLRDWLGSMQLPVSLPQVGVRRDQLPLLARAAARHTVVRNNPRPIGSERDVLAILELAWCA